MNCCNGSSPMAPRKDVRKKHLFVPVSMDDIRCDICDHSIQRTDKFENIHACFWNDPYWKTCLTSELSEATFVQNHNARFKVMPCRLPMRKVENNCFKPSPSIT